MGISTDITPHKSFYTTLNTSLAIIKHFHFNPISNLLNVFSTKTEINSRIDFNCGDFNLMLWSRLMIGLCSKRPVLIGWEPTCKHQFKTLSDNKVPWFSVSGSVLVITIRGRKNFLPNKKITYLSCKNDESKFPKVGFRL